MPKRARHRVVVDTNLWISFLLTKNYSKLDPFFVHDKLILLFSQELINEFIEVARRPKFKKYFSLDDLEDLLLKIKLAFQMAKYRILIHDDFLMG